MSLLFYHGHDCDKSVVTVIFSSMTVIFVCVTVIFSILTVIYYILTVILGILTEMRLLMTVILTSVTVMPLIYDCDADVLSKSDILLYNPKLPKLANDAVEDFGYCWNA